MKTGMNATKGAFFHLVYFARKVEERAQNMAEELAAQAGRDTVAESDVIAAYNKLFPNFWSKGINDGSDRHEGRRAARDSEKHQDDEGGVQKETDLAQVQGATRSDAQQPQSSEARHQTNHQKTNQGNEKTEEG